MWDKGGGQLREGATKGLLLYEGGDVTGEQPREKGENQQENSDDDEGPDSQNVQVFLGYFIFFSNANNTKQSEQRQVIAFPPISKLPT